MRREAPARLRIAPTGGNGGLISRDDAVKTAIEMGRQSETIGRANFNASSSRCSWRTLRVADALLAQLQKGTTTSAEDSPASMSITADSDCWRRSVLKVSRSDSWAG